MYRNMPQTSVPLSGGFVPSANPHNGAAGQIGSAVTPAVQGIRRDFTYTPQFDPAITTNGQTGVPRG